MPSKIPLSDIDLGPAELEAVSRVLASKWLTMGEVTQAFEAAFAEFLGVRHAFAVANCTAALHMAHLALGIGPGDEVICPSLTFVATANSVLYCGGTPVFAEVGGEHDLNVAPDSILRRITPRTKAITVVHYAGYPCAMDRIMEIARAHNLPVVEDVAHAPGAAFDGRKAGTFGAIGCFSFFSNKNMTTGEGGMIVTDSDALAEKLRLLRSHGMTTLTLDRHKGHAHSYDVLALGYNFRIDEIRAALGIEQLQRLSRNNAARREIVGLYRERLQEVDEITVPFAAQTQESAYHIFPVLLEAGRDTEAFRRRLAEDGIQTSMHYPPIHLFTFYRQKFGYAPGTLPVTEAIARREVTLPLFPQMTSATVARIVDRVKDALRPTK